MDMEQIAVFGVILLFWGIGALAERREKRSAMLRAMSDDELITAMHGPLHFDNQYRREYERRHPFVAPARDVKVREIAFSIGNS